MDSKIVSMDLGLRKKIYIRVSSYHPNDQNEIRRAYKGHFQPLSHKFPQRNIGGDVSRFNHAQLNDPT